MWWPCALVSRRPLAPHACCATCLMCHMPIVSPALCAACLMCHMPLVPHALPHAGLRKLSLLSDNCSLPLPLLPFLPHLAGHLTHLAIERAHLEHPSDLSCLSMLTRLELLSLKLNIDPPDGCWLPDGGGSACSSPRGSGSEGQLGGSCPASPTVLMGQLSLGEAGDKDAQQQGQAQPSERFDCEESELSGGGGRGNGVVAPPDPGLVDLSWLRQLTRLRMAWLEVRGVYLARGTVCKMV